MDCYLKAANQNNAGAQSNIGTTFIFFLGDKRKEKQTNQN